MADTGEPSENPECVGVEMGEIFEEKAHENAGMEEDLTGEGTFSTEDNADDEELVGDGADDDDDQDGDEINYIGWVEDLWNKKKAEEAASVSKDNKKEGEEEEPTAGDDYEMKDESEEMVDSSLTEQTLPEKEKPSGDLKSSSESETATGAEEKKALPGLETWKEDPESGSPEALAKDSLCIPSAYFGPSFDKNCFKFCIQASPILYSFLVHSRLRRVLKAADTVVAKCGPKGSSRRLEIYCQTAPPLLRQLMFTPLGGENIHFHLEKRNPTAWTKVSYRGKMMSAPVSFSETPHTVKFSLHQPYFRKHLGKPGMFCNYQDVKDRSLFLSNLPTSSDIGWTLKALFPLALNIDVVKVSENQRSAVLTMMSRQAVVDHLISIQNLCICGRKVELGSTNMTQQDAINKFLPRQSPKKQTSSQTGKSGEADGGDKTGAKQGKKATSEEEEEKKRGREQRERNQQKERGPKPQRDRSRLRAGDNRPQMRRQDQGPAGMRGARTGFQKPRRPERWAGRGRMLQDPMMQPPALFPDPSVEMEIMMQHGMQLERELALRREMEVQRDMERHRETLLQRERDLQRKREREEEERYGRRDWQERDRWEWEGANRQRRETNRQRGDANRQRGDANRQREAAKRQREAANRQREEARAREEQQELELQQREELMREKERLEQLHQDALRKLKMVEEQQQRDRQELQRQEQRHQRDRQELQRKQRSAELEKKRVQQQLEAERRRQEWQRKKEWQRKPGQQDRFQNAQRGGRRNQQQHGSLGRMGRRGEGLGDTFYGDDGRQDDGCRQEGQGQRSKSFSPGGGSFQSEASTKRTLEMEVARHAQELQKSLDLLEKIKTDPAQVSADLSEMRRMSNVDRPNEFAPSTSFNRQQEPASGYWTQQPELYDRDVNIDPSYNSNQDYNNRGQYFDYGHEKPQFEHSQRDDQTHTAAGGYSSGNWTQNSAAGHQSSIAWGAGATNTDNWQGSGGYNQPQAQTYNQTDDYNMGRQQTEDSYGQDRRHEGYGSHTYDQGGSQGRDSYDQREGHRGGQARGEGSSSGHRNDGWFRNNRDYRR